MFDLRFHTVKVDQREVTPVSDKSNPKHFPHVRISKF